ncbi:MAG: hypothetical protein ABMA02_15100 [Saprospiraceae bacterium]
MNRFDQIERYLQGRMPEEELRTFEAELAADPELAALARQHRIERYGLELLVERDLLAKMQTWDRETELFAQVQPHRAKVRPLTWVLRAAAVLALAALGYWLLRDNSAASTEQPAPIVRTKPEIKSRVPSVRKRPQPTAPYREENAPEEPTEDLAEQQPEEPTPAPIEEMGTDDDFDYAALANEFFRERDFVAPKGTKSGEAYNETLKNYQDGKYNETVSKPTPGSTEAIDQKELLALAQYKSRRFADAASTFREIIASGKQPHAQRAQWGLTLTLLQELPKQKGTFYRALTDILRDPDHLFYTKAKRLEGMMNDE